MSKETKARLGQMFDRLAEINRCVGKSREGNTLYLGDALSEVTDALLDITNHLLSEPDAPEDAPTVSDEDLDDRIEQARKEDWKAGYVAGLKEAANVADRRAYPGEPAEDEIEEEIRREAEIIRGSILFRTLPDQVAALQAPDPVSPTRAPSAKAGL